MARRKKQKLSNNQLAALALVAIVISVSSTFTALDMGLLDNVVGPTGAATASGSLSITVTSTTGCKVNKNISLGSVAADATGGGSGSSEFLNITNTGNVNLNISIGTNGTGIFDGASKVASDYRYRNATCCGAPGGAGGTGTCNDTGNQAFGNWTNAPSSKHDLLVANMSFNQTGQFAPYSCAVKVKIHVPVDESAVAKSDVIAVNCTSTN